MFAQFLKSGVQAAAGHKFILAGALGLAISAFATGWQVHSKFVAASEVRALETKLADVERQLEQQRSIDRRLQAIAATAARSWRETLAPVRERVRIVVEEREVFRDAIEDIEDDNGRLDEPATRGVCVIRAEAWGLSTDLCDTP